MRSIWGLPTRGRFTAPSRADAECRRGSFGRGIGGECSGLFAGKPAPTGSVVITNFMHDTKHCGSWLASDGGMTFNTCVG
ncbi:hypothetical protein EJA71_17520 [Pseudomonas sp. PB106]|nr:hypothetical protein EJA71_17520 [Pseudomonas sp. PB106]